jgi:hypothetical protein
MDYLGVILEKGIMRMDPVKIAGIKNWPTPTKVKDIRSFLGFCNFYRPFIRGFAHIAQPLNELTQKTLNGYGPNDVRRHLMSYETGLQANQYWHTQNWTNNSNWRLTHQDSQ